MVQGLGAGHGMISEHITIEPLGPQHDRAAFICSKPNLTQYFTGVPEATRTLDQDLKYNLANPFVMVDKQTGEVLGYFTLCTQSVAKESLPRKLAAKLGYRDIPTMLLGRMAVHERLAGRGYGTNLLLSALLQVLRMTDGGKGCYAVVLDAGDDELVNWYAKRGFVLATTAHQPRRMILPVIKILNEIARQAG